MTNTLLYTRSFAGGIISPDMYGRIDDIKYNTGVEVARNFLILPQGPAVNRAGTKFVAEVKDSTVRTRLIPFRYSLEQTMVIEAGEAYFRFHTYGATLQTDVSTPAPWDVATAYSVGDVVTKSGSSWYCMAANTGNDPDTPANQYGATPVITTTWSLTAAASTSIPSGYSPTTSLPTVAVAGAKYYLTITTYETSGRWVVDGEGYPAYIERVTEVIKYEGYTGVSVTSPSGFWFELPGTDVTEGPYEIPTPYAAADLFDLRFVQSADVLTITHPNYAPRELRRLGAQSWSLTEITFGSTLAAPTISSVTPTTGSAASDTQSYSYVATNVSDDQLDESNPSAVVSATNQLFDTGALNTITFSGAARRNVYRLSGGIYGFIGQTETATMVDDNIAPDISRAPPQNQDPFATDWPAAVTYFEQRRAFGGTTLLPQTFWLTKSGTESNLDYSIPVRDNDAISIKIAARQANNILHMLPLGDLLVFTTSAVWRVTSVNSDALTPSSVSVRPQTFIGSTNVQPVSTGSAALYAAARGGHVRSLAFDFNAQSYISVDMSLRASHLFDYRSIVALDYAEAATPTVWAVSSDGSLLGMTLVPEQEVFAWHYHDTFQGEFESICVVGEGQFDVLYTIVKRTIGEATVRYIERLEPRYFPSLEESYFVDCGITYSGAATTTITGLDHLEGETVSILADGGVVSPREVVSGAVELDVAAELVHVGLPIAADCKTLPLAVDNLPAYGQGRQKNVNKAILRVNRSSGFLVGPNEDTLTPAKIRTTETYGTPPALQTGDVEVDLLPEWNDNGAVVIRQIYPVPLEISSLTLDVVFGS
jgi:hypothetical protein